MKKVIVLLLVLLVVISLFAGCKNDDVIIMGTNAEFPPFEFIGDDGEITGFDIEIAKEIAKDLGKELVIEDMAFDALINALSSGKVDFVIAGMSVTEDRKKNVDFSDSYFNAGQVIIVKKDNDTIMSCENLVGKKIGVQIGTTGDLAASEIEGVEMARYNKAIDAILGLKNGDVDAVVVDGNPAEYFVEKNDDLKILPEYLIIDDYAIAIKKGNEELLESINDTLSSIKESGKYDEFYNSYFGE